MPDDVAAVLAATALRPHAGASAPTACSSAVRRCVAIACDLADGAVQRRRQPRRDERQRHPLPRPGGAARSRPHRGRRSRSRPTAAFAASTSKVASPEDDVVGERRHGRDRAPSSRRTGWRRARRSIRCGPSRTSRSATRTPSSLSTTSTRSISSPLGRAGARGEPRGRRGRPRHRERSRCGSTSAAPASPRRAAPAPARPRARRVQWGARRATGIVVHMDGGDGEVTDRRRHGHPRRPGRATSPTSRYPHEPHRTRHPGADRARSASRCPPTHDDDTEASLDELVAARRHRRAPTRRRASCSVAIAPDPATFIGKGKAEELRRAVPRRRRRHRRVRQRAHAGAAVQPREAARPHRHRPHRGDPRHLRPERPHPRRQGPGRAGAAALPAAAAASRPRGRAARSRRVGIGTRGPGETQLEIDRRRMQRRITKLEHDLTDLEQDPQARSARRAAAAACSAIRSSATRTPGSRRCSTGSPTPACSSRTGCSPRSTRRTQRLQLPGGEPVLVTDTVGFVRKLPHQLVEAFKSTLETVADEPTCSSTSSTPAPPDPEAQIDAVRAVLREIGGDQVPELLVFNKADRSRRTRPPGRAPPRLGRDLGADGRGHRRPAPAPSATGSGRWRRSSSSSSPTSAATCSPPSTARARSSSESHATTACGSGPGSIPPRRAASPSSPASTVDDRRAS